MSTPTRRRGVRQVTYKCGHQGREDLSSLEVMRRDSRIKWIKANKVCRSCWAKTSRYVSKEERAEQIRAEAARRAWAALSGSPKQVVWAEAIRQDKFAEMYEAFVVEAETLGEQEYIEQIETPGGAITSAKFWIDHRELSTDLMADEISMYELAEETEACENPY